MADILGFLFVLVTILVLRLHRKLDFAIFDDVKVAAEVTLCEDCLSSLERDFLGELSDAAQVIGSHVAKKVDILQDANSCFYADVVFEWGHVSVEVLLG